MKVSLFALPALNAGTGAPSRAWRISTAEGAFWLLQSGTTARLVALPTPGELGARTANHGDNGLTPGVALALEAETAAALRWVRQGWASAASDAAPLGDAR